MKLVDLLVHKVKPELNHIYTEKPFMVPSGYDLGWFCREHALHVFGLMILLGKKVELCIGDFVLRRPQKDSFCSVGSNSDHAWCCVDGHAPADLSITVKYIYPDLSDVSIIWPGYSILSAPFEILYFKNVSDEEFNNLLQENKLLIGYNEKEKIQYDLINLLEDPYQFLYPPPIGLPTFSEIHGPNLFHAITYHCYRLVTESRMKPLYSYRDPKNTVKGIIKFNVDARDKIRQILSVNNKS